MADDMNPAPGKRRPTWVSVVLAIVIVIGVLVLSLIGTSIYLFNRHVSSQVVSAQSAESEFEQTRRRFAGQQPLIELPRAFDDAPIIHRRDVRSAAPEPQAMHVMVYDRDTGKIVRISIPFWLLRMMSVNGRFRLAQLDLFDDDRARLTMEDLERHGTGLVLDHRDRRGAQVLLWME